MAITLTILWLMKKNYSYIDLLNYYYSFDSLKEGLLTNDYSAVQNAQGEIFDKKCKTNYSLFNFSCSQTLTCFIRYEFTFLFRKAKSLASLYITIIISYIIIKTLNLPDYFKILLLLFSTCSLQLFLTNQKTEETAARKNGYYLKYPFRYFIISKYITVLSVYTFPVIFYLYIFHCSPNIIALYLFVPLQTTLTYKSNNKIIKFLLYLPILFILYFIQ